MNVIHCYLDAFRRYADFSGRSTRPQYWWFALVNTAIFVIVEGALLGRMENVGALRNNINSGSGAMSVVASVLLVYAMAALIPSLALSVRRLHDTGRSGWWLFIQFVPLIGPIWLLVLFCLPSEPRVNRFG